MALTIALEGIISYFVFYCHEQLSVFRFHELSHSYATNLYRAGIDLKTAQYLLGHSTIQMTANIYTHMDKEDAAASVIQLERYHSGGGQEPGDFSKSSQKVVSGGN